MEMKLDVQKLKKLRDSKGWSQSHLAEVAGISLRTIQRVEKSGVVSPESAQSICASYDIYVTDLIINEQSKIEEAPNFFKNMTFKVKNIDKKATIVSFVLAFIIAFVLTF